MLELDLILQGYLDHCYPQADADEQAAFYELLTFADQELQDLLFGDEIHQEARIAHVIEQIKHQPATN
jgi:succinate dehydrogenase flavin-adding protein (antitoxin of CptAB toxin-antitoxin module)